MTDYLELYKKMVLVRTLESKFLDLAKTTGEISDLHLNRGQEAISIGVTSVLRPSDYMVTHHRTISHAIGKGMALQPLVDEILGRSTGVCGGKSNEMHLRDPSTGYMFSFQLVGTGMPVAAGVAWASRYVKKEDNITVLFIGDAASSNAQFLEGANAAALFNVPLLIVIENNHLAGNITPKYYFPEGTTLTDRLSAFGIPSFPVDGNKIDKVVDTAKRLVEITRTISKPQAMICDTTRLLMHKIGQGDARTPEQIAILARRDPLIYAQKMLEPLGLTNDDVTVIYDGAMRVVDEAIDRGHAAPWPTKEEYYGLPAS